MWVRGWGEYGVEVFSEYGLDVFSEHGLEVFSEYGLEGTGYGLGVRAEGVQGYLAHKKQRPPRTLQ